MKHYYRFKKHGDPNTLLRTPSDGFCKIDTCDNEHVAKGFCDKHYWKYKKYGSATSGRTYNPSGESSTRTYSCWKNMKQRCLNPNNKYYHRYGGRGIKIHKTWVDNFNKFLEDMGDCPPGLTIERIDNEGDYEPGNCKWDTMENQTRNRSLRFDNKTGAIGVSKTKYGTYTAKLKNVCSKNFKTLEEAIKYRLLLEIEYWGEIYQTQFEYLLDDNKR